MVQYHKSKTYYVVQIGPNTGESLADYCLRNDLNYHSIRKRFTTKKLTCNGFFFLIQPTHPLLTEDLYKVSYVGETEFSRSVIKAIEAAGSRPRLARILGVNRSTIRNWIYSVNAPTDNNKELIEKYLQEPEKYNARLSLKLKSSD